MRSLSSPIIGWPIAVPIFNNPTTSVPRKSDESIARAKSDRGKSGAMYPNIMIKARERSKSTALLRRRLISKANCVGRLRQFLSRIKAVAARVATSVTSPVTRPTLDVVSSHHNFELMDEIN